MAITAWPVHGCRRAYTLIEVLVVVAIIGLAGAIVVPQMLSAGTFGVQGAVRMLVADIHYVQSQAVAHQSERRLVFDVERERYSMLDDSGEPMKLQWRTGGDGSTVIDFRQDRRFTGVRLESATFPGMEDRQVLAFDNLGAPLSGGVVVLSYRDERYRIEVAAFTGRVTVERMGQ